MHYVPLLLIPLALVVLGLRTLSRWQGQVEAHEREQEEFRPH